ncbi:MAG: elongation factor P [Candidatus Omnitrophica bacterium]|nr:elongation factor P [Candidatus Omnitrophota bacterium]MBI3010517.1 elongation factor P [Candidatus Omnitrophota bacterium]
MISTNEFKNGGTIAMDGQLWVIVEFQHVKPGKGGAFVRTKLRRLRDNSVIERTFRAGEKFEDAYIEKRNLQYLYRTADTFHLMDTKNYEEVTVSTDLLGATVGFLKENAELEGQFHNGQMIGIQPPIFVDLHVSSTEPGVRGDTSKPGMKPATLETGATVQVPLFVEIGDMIRVDTRNSSYVSRV